MINSGRGPQRLNVLPVRLIAAKGERVREGFTKRYWVDRLVDFEAHDDAGIAAKRERAMKRWRRDWKITLVEKHNPTWRDLFADVLVAGGFEW